MPDIHSSTDMQVKTGSGGTVAIAAAAFPLLTMGTALADHDGSYQTDLARALTPDVAVFTNLSPDHLDRHGGPGETGPGETSMEETKPGGIKP